MRWGREKSLEKVCYSGDHSCGRLELSSTGKPWNATSFVNTDCSYNHAIIRVYWVNPMTAVLM